MGPIKKNLKATKKFEKKHLKGVLDNRKAGAKIKQRSQIKAKQQLKKARDAEYYKDKDADVDADAKEVRQRSGAKKGAKVNEMSVDDFFQGGFEFIEKDLDTKKKNDKTSKLGKRKRAEDGAEKDGSGSEDEEEFTEFSAGEDGEPFGTDSENDGDDGDDDMGMSKAAMDELAIKDPEFYKFLKETDPEALDFDENADLAEVDDLSGGEDDGGDDDDDDDDDEAEKQPKKKRRKEKKPKPEAVAPEGHAELTEEMVARWKALMVETKSLKAARQIVLAFRAAAHLNEAAEDEERGRAHKYTISSPQVFNDVLLAALRHVPEVMNHHLPIKESASGKLYVQTEGKKFKTLSLLLKTYTASVIHLLGTLSDDKTLKLTISSLEPILPYLLTFRKLLKALVKTVVHFWSQASSSESTKITSFLVLRRLVVIGDKGVRETVLKTTYQGLIQGCRVTNVNTIRGINLLKNSAAELWGIDQAVGYTTAFAFIRQLAIHLRNSIVNNKKESHRIIYNWQYTHSLDFWSVVLSEHCSPIKEAEAGRESQLKLLIYPLVQVTLGAMRLIPSATYFPFRFHLVRSVLRLSRATGTYIPVAAQLLEVLNSAEMRKPPKSSTLKPLDFSVSYKCPKSYLRTRTYQDGAGDQVAELLSEFLLLWATNIAFPELCLPVVIQLKRWLKQSRRKGTGNCNMKLHHTLVTLVQKVEANAKFVEDRRAKVDFAPRDRAKVDAFLRDFDWEKTPLGAYVSAQRKLRAEKAKLMEEARAQDEERRREDEKGLLAAGDVSEDESEGELDVMGEEDELEEGDEDVEDDDEDDDEDED